VRSARKHIGWVVRSLPGGEAFRARINGITQCAAQWQAVRDYFDELAARQPTLDAMPHDERQAA
jgi:tRNA-dihydrouridine synthase B